MPAQGTSRWGVSPATLIRRASYRGGRKGRSALRRLLRMHRCVVPIRIGTEPPKWLLLFAETW